MAKYLLIQSRDPFDTAEVSRDYELAGSLAQAGNEVTMFLVQNGVLPARKGARDVGLQNMMASGVEVLSDDFSLRERGIGSAGLRDGIRPSSLETVVDHLADGSKTVWL